MTGALKNVLIALAAIVGLFLAAAIVISILFDPNDYRDRIAEEVKRETGRDLVIEGDLELTFFPWFGVSIGKTTLGNAPGFGDEPFLTFEAARASMQVLPLVRGDGLEVGNIVLDSFSMNLEVAEDGRNNWRMSEGGQFTDGVDTSDELVDEAVAATDEQEVTLSVASVEITNAAVSYADARAGESYSLTNFNFVTGRITGDDPIDIRSDFDFEVQPAGIAGDFSIETSLVPTEDGVTFSAAEISTLGIDATVSVASDLSSADVQVDAFSLKSLMTRLAIEPPVTADPDVLGKIIFDGTVALDDDAFAVTGVELVVDDTTFTGGLSVARNEAGTISVDLAADSIDLDRYMSPAADPAATGGNTVPVEIPVKLIRALNIKGKLTVQSADLSGMSFENVDLGLNAAGGNMRLNPISADFFGGKYDGDVQINAAGNVPALSVNENIIDVSLGSLAQAMFDQENITGTINGSFRLSGRGENLVAIQRSLDGNISMELKDGAWEGTDVWYELRRARALYKQEQPPEPQLPARTEFSNVRATGPVEDGVFRNNDLFAELPFMQIAGRGMVDFPTAEVDYRMTARVLRKPEFATDATAEELEDFTEREIPLKISGSLADPSITVDIEELLKQEVQEKVEEEIKDLLLDKLFGDG